MVVQQDQCVSLLRKRQITTGTGAAYCLRAAEAEAALRLRESACHQKEEVAAAADRHFRREGGAAPAPSASNP